LVDVAEEGDFFLGVIINRIVGAYDNDVRLNADVAQLAYAVLCWLGFELFTGGEEGQPGEVDIERVFGADIFAHLANCFEEGKAFDIANGATDLDKDDVGLAEAGHLSDMAFDFVGDVRDHLNRAAKIVSPPFLGYDIVIDLAACHIAELVQILVDESLVVTQVQICFGAVFGYEYFAVLIGGHGARIDIEVGIELHCGYADAPGLEQKANGGDGYAFTKTGYYPASNKDIFGHLQFPLIGRLLLIA